MCEFDTGKSKKIKRKCRVHRLMQMSVQHRLCVRNQVKFKFMVATALSAAGQGVKSVCDHPGVQEEEEVVVVVGAGYIAFDLC